MVLQLGGSDPASWRCALGTVVMANSPPPEKEPFFFRRNQSSNLHFSGESAYFFWGVRLKEFIQHTKGEDVFIPLVIPPIIP